jgi:hypothetical protein
VFADAAATACEYCATRSSYALLPASWLPSSWLPNALPKSTAASASPTAVHGERFGSQLSDVQRRCCWC